MNTAGRVLSVLQLYVGEKSEWTVEEAAAEIGVSVSTAYRYFRSLCAVGLLDSFNGNAYILGPAIIEYDRQIRINDPVIRVGQPVMQRMIARSGGTGIALLCRIYRNCVMCVHQEGKLSSNKGVRYERGRPMPMWGSPSKIIFANLPARSVRWFFNKYPNEIAEAGLGRDEDTLRANLRKIRKAGVWVTQGEVDRRVGISAPVFDPNKKVLGSISMVMMQSEASPQAIANVSALVEAASREIRAGLENPHVSEGMHSSHSDWSDGDSQIVSSF